jgi:hypothetical protein
MPVRAVQQVQRTKRMELDHHQKDVTQHPFIAS